MFFTDLQLSLLHGMFSTDLQLSLLHANGCKKISVKITYVEI